MHHIKHAITAHIAQYLIMSSGVLIAAIEGCRTTEPRWQNNAL